MPLVICEHGVDIAASFAELEKRIIALEQHPALTKKELVALIEEPEPPKEK